MKAVTFVVVTLGVAVFSYRLGRRALESASGSHPEASFQDASYRDQPYPDTPFENNEIRALSDSPNEGERLQDRGPVGLDMRPPSAAAPNGSDSSAVGDDGPDPIRPGLPDFARGA